MMYSVSLPIFTAVFGLVQLPTFDKVLELELESTLV